MKELVIKDTKGKAYCLKLDDKDYEELRKFKWHARGTRFNKVTFTVDKEYFYNNLSAPRKWFGFDLINGRYRRISLSNLIIIKLWGIKYCSMGCSLIFKNGDPTDFRRENLTIRGKVKQRTDEEIDNFVEPDENKTCKEVRRSMFYGNDWSAPITPNDEPNWQNSMRQVISMFSDTTQPLESSLMLDEDRCYVVIKAHSSKNEEPKHMFFTRSSDLTQFLKFNNLLDLNMSSSACYKDILEGNHRYGLYIINVNKPVNTFGFRYNLDTLCKYVDTLGNLDVRERLIHNKAVLKYMIFEGDDLYGKFGRINK